MTDGAFPTPHRTPVVLDGTLVDDRPPVRCGGCAQDVPRGGGVQTTPTRWICSACWKLKQNRRPASERQR